MPKEQEGFPYQKELSFPHDAQGALGFPEEREIPWQRLGEVDDFCILAKREKGLVGFFKEKGKSRVGDCLPLAGFSAEEVAGIIEGHDKKPVGLVVFADFNFLADLDISSLVDSLPQMAKIFLLDERGSRLDSQEEQTKEILRKMGLVDIKIPKTRINGFSLIESRTKKQSKRPEIDLKEKQKFKRRMEEMISNYNASGWFVVDTEEIEKFCSSTKYALDAYGRLDLGWGAKIAPIKRQEGNILELAREKSGKEIKHTCDCLWEVNLKGDEPTLLKRCGDDNCNGMPTPVSFEDVDAGKHLVKARIIKEKNGMIFFLVDLFDKGREDTPPIKTVGTKDNPLKIHRSLLRKGE
ncbi:MAG: hypothetical protein ABIH88_03375 [Patescibacteria group bacterium]|nr:hypothetical protein [Patescibacteria group bacterium]